MASCRVAHGSVPEARGRQPTAHGLRPVAAARDLWPAPEAHGGAPHTHAARATRGARLSYRRGAAVGILGLPLAADRRQETWHTARAAGALLLRC